jgi:hypothetical protein
MSNHVVGGMDETRRERAKRFRERAQAARELAEQFRDGAAIEAMQAAAILWEEMAAKEERRLNDPL